MTGTENTIGNIGPGGTALQARDIYGTINILTGGRPLIPRQLAPAAKYFTNRSRERTRLDSFHRSSSRDAAPRVVVLRGLPGVGKTALALKWLGEIADSYSDGQLYLELGGPGPERAVSPPSLLEQLLIALGADANAIPHSSGAQRGMFRSLTAGRSLILLLDDAATASQVSAVLPNSEHALVVVTCTERIPDLAAEGAAIVDIEPMDLEAIEEYLTRSLPAAKVAEASSGSVARLAARCHGLPQLAHMAVRRLNSDPLETIDGLVERFDEAVVGAARPDEEGRDRSVRAEIDTFLRALTPLALRTYRLLGLHPGRGFDAWAAAAAAETGPGSAREALAELWRNGLVDSVGDAGGGRYRFPEIIEHDARARAEAFYDVEDRAAVHARYAAYYLAGVIEAAEKGTRRWTHTRQADHPPALPVFATAEAAWSWMRVNLMTILAIADWCQKAGDHRTVWQLAEVSDGYLREAGRYADRFSLIRLGIVSAEACGAQEVEARLRNQHGLALLDLRREREAVEEFSRALRLSEEQGDGRGQGAALECLGIAAQRRGRDEEALAYFDRAEPFKAAMGRPQAMAVLGLLRARSSVTLGAHEEALDLLASALHVFDARDEDGRPADEVNAAKALLERGRALVGLSRTDTAVAELRRALEIFVERGHLYQQAQVHEALARAVGRRRDRAGHLREALGLYRAIGNDAEARRLEGD
ncbi:hypothetical protein ACFXKD_13490 [Nocardiopsis aegyptia]|uniref:hypothetical protein n=1 Tax=Nocardiopsis aegyptia TaxID=220378 RepID=UPI00366B5B07